MLEVSHIDVFYGSLQVLWDVSIEVDPGEMVAIIGSNGSGKSTLLNAIAGGIHPRRGRIVYDGNDITLTDPFQTVALGISLVPEGRRIFPDMTVFENLRIGSYPPRGRVRRDENLEYVYRLFPRLKERRNQIAKTLSGGERQMMMIGSALMADPKLLLVDEMSLGLSPLVVSEIYRALKEIRVSGITIVFVEQNVRRTLEEAERAYILETGRVVLSGTAEALRAEEKIRSAYFGTPSPTHR